MKNANKEFEGLSPEEIGIFVQNKLNRVKHWHTVKLPDAHIQMKYLWLSHDCCITGGPETLLEITGTIFLGNFETTANRWDSDEENKDEVHVTISELEIKFNYDKKDIVNSISTNDEEEKLVSSQNKHASEVHMHGLFTIDSFNTTTVVLSDWRFNVHLMDLKSCVFMTIENCTNDRVVSEINTMTKQSELQFKSYLQKADIFDINSEVCYCKKSARISMESCMIK